MYLPFTSLLYKAMTKDTDEHYKVGSPGNQLPSLSARSKSYLINITKDTFIALIT